VKAAIAAVLIGVALTLLALWIASVVNTGRERTCAELGARHVNTPGHFLCISPDGRVVGP
jgi:hypothetical protein